MTFDVNGVHSWTKDDVTINLNMFADRCFHSYTHVENKKEATCLEDGYSGDTICDLCNVVIEKGHVIEALGHNYVGGVCKNCNHKDPDYVELYPRGDVNGDMKVNSKDYVIIKNHIMGTTLMTEEQMARAELYIDGQITSKDYVVVRNIIMEQQ